MAGFTNATPAARRRSGGLVKAVWPKSDESDAVLYAVDASLARNGSLSRGLTAAFTSAAADPVVRVILLSGAGRGFCAGADMQVLGELSNGPNAVNSGSGGLRYDGLMLLPKPVVAAIHGACAGMGLVMACAADIRIVAGDAFFLAPFRRLVLCAEGGLAWLLPRLIGAGNAADLLLSGRRLDAKEALAKGLVSQILPVQDFADAAFAYAVAMAQGAPSSLFAIKKQLRDAATQDFETARIDALNRTRGTLAESDFREAMAARREGREPAFTPVVADFAPSVSLR